jgi:hypothetical protein
MLNNCINPNCGSRVTNYNPVSWVPGCKPQIALKKEQNEWF